MAKRNVAKDYRQFMETRTSVVYKFYVEWLYYFEVEYYVLLLLPRKGVTLQGHIILPQDGCCVRKTCCTRMVCVLRLKWPIC